jgi:Ser/Thr protein kinase RdoA (MazF antagonist)
VVPTLRRTTSGHLGTDVSTDAGPRTCALFDWVAGRSLRTRLTRPTAAALGRLAARLHADAEAWATDERPDVLVADTVAYWLLPDRLTDPDVPFRGVFADARHETQAVLDELWRAPPHRPHLLHGDLTAANVVVTGDGTLAPIDFQDVVWGFDVQDLAITIAALRRAHDGPRLVDAFQAGYTTQRRWPDLPPALLDALIAARALNQINLTLNLEGRADLDAYLTAHADSLRAWLRSRRFAIGTRAATPDETWP